MTLISTNKQQPRQLPLAQNSIYRHARVTKNKKQTTKKANNWLPAQVQTPANKIKRKKQKIQKNG
jgi:hypothetical protein